MKVEIFLCFLISSTQVRANEFNFGHGRVTQIANDMKKSNQEAMNEFKQAMNKLDSALVQHEMVKRDIENTFGSITNKVYSVPESCQDETYQKLIGLKTQSIQNYLNCTGSTIFRAVGDSVEIVTISLQLFYQIFRSIDDVTNGFTDCYQSDIMNSITCTIESIIILGVDTKQSVNLAENYRSTISRLANDVTNIIDICQGKSKNTTYEALEILNNCSLRV